MAGIGGEKTVALITWAAPLCGFMSAGTCRENRNYVPTEFISVEPVILHYHGTQGPPLLPAAKRRGEEHCHCACLSPNSAKSRAPLSKLRWGPMCVDALHPTPFDCW